MSLSSTRKDEAHMRKMILMAIAGFFWKKYKAQKQGQGTVGQPQTPRY